MKRTYALEKILENGGKWSPSPHATLTIDGKDIVIKFDDGEDSFEGTWWDHQEESGGIYFSSTSCLNEIKEIVRKARKLATIFEYDLGELEGDVITKTINVEKIVEVEKVDMEKHKLEGKVEAYENLLIGRTVAVGQ